MKKTIALLLALLLCLGLAAPALAEGVTVRGQLTYSTLIDPQYEDARVFSEDLAAVKKDGKWGYVNADNETVIPFEYDFAFDFHEGYAIVMTNAKEDWVFGPEGGTHFWQGDIGFIDHAGNYTKFELYGNVFDDDNLLFYNGYTHFASPFLDAYTLFDTDGRAVLSVDFEQGIYYTLMRQVTEGLVVFQTMEGELGWAAPDGSSMYTLPYDLSEAGDRSVYYSNLGAFNQGMVPVWVCTQVPNGTEPGWDDETMSFNDGYDRVYRMGFMDREGNWVIEPQFDYYYYSGVYTTYQLFGETGLAMVGKDGMMGAIDKQGNTVIPFEYEDLWPSNYGMIAFKKDGAYGYLDTETLQVAIAPQYEMVTGFSGMGLAVVYDGTKAWLIDRKGSAVPGSDVLDPDTYIRRLENGDIQVYAPDEYVVIQADGKYGFGHIEYRKPLPEKSEMDSWAYDEVVEAIETELVPEYLQDLYRRDINRLEFCELVIQAVCEITGKDMDALVQETAGRSLYDVIHDYPFTDVSDRDVIAAYALGIIQGRGNGRFDPYAGISRQEAAVMLMRAAKLLGADVSAAGDAGFADSDKIAGWAKEAVDFVFAHEIMNGTGDDAFSPLNPYTREQSYMTVLRLFKDVTGK